VKTLLLCLLLSACSQNGTGVLLQLVGRGSVDQLEVVGRWNGASQRSGATMAMGRPVALPFNVLVELADVRLTASFDVTARLGGVVVGQGTSPPVLVLPHQTPSVEVVLGANLDLGVEDGAPDLGADLTVVDDLRTTDDLRSLPDLLAPDLLKPDLALPPCSGASTCVDGGTTPCTGFESGAVDAPFLALARTGCTVTVDTTRACRGTHSVHVTLPAASGGSTQYEATVFEQTYLPSTTFHVRAFLYLPANVPSDDYFMQAYQDFTPFHAITLVAHSSGTMQMGNSVANQPTTASSLHFPLGRWVCAEWKIVSSTGTTGSVRLFLDGSEVADAAQSGVATQPATPFNTVSVGLTSTPASSVGATEMWVDEIRMDTNPIGCLK
jgi:hypothetical protein